MKKEKRIKWVVWYKHSRISREEPEYQEMLEHTNIFSALWDYIYIYFAFKPLALAIDFDIKLYHIKNFKK